MFIFLNETSQVTHLVLLFNRLWWFLSVQQIVRSYAYFERYELHSYVQR